nr:hypothetical protein [Xanthomonas sp. XNM01]
MGKAATAGARIVTRAASTAGSTPARRFAGDAVVVAVQMRRMAGLAATQRGDAGGAGGIAVAVAGSIRRGRAGARALAAAGPGPAIARLPPWQ